MLSCRPFLQSLQPSPLPILPSLSLSSSSDSLSISSTSSSAVPCRAANLPSSSSSSPSDYVSSSNVHRNSSSRSCPFFSPLATLPAVRGENNGFSFDRSSGPDRRRQIELEICDSAVCKVVRLSSPFSPTFPKVRRFSSSFSPSHPPPPHPLFTHVSPDQVRRFFLIRLQSAAWRYVLRRNRNGNGHSRATCLSVLRSCRLKVDRTRASQCFLSRVVRFNRVSARSRFSLLSRFRWFRTRSVSNIAPYCRRSFSSFYSESFEWLERKVQRGIRTFDRTKVQMTGAHLFPVWSSLRREKPAKQQLRVTVARSCWNSRRFNAEACRFLLRHLRLYVAASTDLVFLGSSFSSRHGMPSRLFGHSCLRSRRTSALDKYSPTTRTSSSIPNRILPLDPISPVSSSRGRAWRSGWKNLWQMAVTIEIGISHVSLKVCRNW